MVAEMGETGSEADERSGVFGPICVVSSSPTKTTDTPMSPLAQCQSSLVTAIKESNLKGAKQALKDGADVNLVSDGEYTPLMQAASLGHLEILELLLDNGARVLDSCCSYNALMCLMGSSNENDRHLLKCLNLLLDRGADPFTADWEGASPLMHAVRKNREQLVVRLMTSGCSVNDPDLEGWTPIFYAVQNNNMGMTQTLMDGGAEVNVMDGSGRTPKSIAAITNNRDLIKMVTTQLPPKYTAKDVQKVKPPQLASKYKLLLHDGPKIEDRLYGFNDEAIKLLRGINLDYVASIMSMKNLQLAELLTWEDDEWNAAGIRLSYHHKKINTSVQLYHEKEWGNGAIPDLSQVVSNGSFDLTEAVHALTSFLRMTHITSASSRYLLRRATPGFMTSDIAQDLDNLSIALAVSKKNIRQLIQACEGLENDCVPPDLIKSKTAPAKKSVISLVAILATTIIISSVSVISVKYFFNKSLLPSSILRFFK